MPWTVRAPSSAYLFWFVSGACPLVGVSYVGNDIKQIKNIAQFRQCQAECQKVLECTHVTLFPNSSCFLKSVKSEILTEISKALSGSKDCFKGELFVQSCFSEK